MTLQFCATYELVNSNQNVPLSRSPPSLYLFISQSHQMQAQMQPIQQHHVRGGGSRRGRGRSSNNSGGHRRDFSSRQINVIQDINHQQSSAAAAPHLMESSQIMPATSNYGHASYFVNPYVGLYPNQFIGHPHSSSSHATGSPLYVTGAMPGYGYAMPGYPGMVYPMMPMDYMVDAEKTDEGMNGENGNAAVQPHWQVEYAAAHIEPGMQHQQPEEPPAPALEAAVSIIQQ